MPALVRRIAVVNMKGGVGKTTTAVHVAACAAMLGHRVLLVDADRQGTAGEVFSARPSRTLNDVMLGRCDAAAAIVNVRPGLDVLGSSPAAFLLDAALLPGDSDSLLNQRLASLPYDLAILDSSPAMGLLTYNVLTAATDMVMPVAMDWMAIMGARRTLQGVRTMTERRGHRLAGAAFVLPTMVNSVTNATKAAMQALQADAELATLLYAPGIRQCLDLTYATASRQTIFEYAPSSRGADDYQRFTSFLLSRPGAPTASRVPAESQP